METPMHGPRGADEPQRWTDAVADGVVVFDRDGRFLYVNDAALRLARRPREALVGRTLVDVTGQVSEAFAAAFARVAGGAEDEAVIDAEPAALGVALRTHLVRAGDVVVCTVRDVTPLRRSERDRDALVARLRVLEAASRSFGDHTDDPRVVATRLCQHVLAALGDGCVVRVRAADGVHLETLAFCHRDPALQAELGPVVTAPVRADGAAGLVLRAGAPVEIEGELGRLLEGDELAAAERMGVRALLAAPLRVRGAVLGVVTVAARQSFPDGARELVAELGDHAALALTAAETLREEREARAALEAANERLARWQQLFEHAGWGIALTDPATGRIIAVNPAYAAMHGYTAEEARGLPILATMAPEEHARLPAVLAEVHARGQLACESIHVRKDGSRFPVAVDLVVVKDGDGRVVYRALNLQDITERQRLLAEAESAARKQAALAERVSRLQAITAGLAEAITMADLADTVVRHAGAAVDARGVALMVLGDDGRLETVAATGAKKTRLPRFVALEAARPVAAVVREGAPVWLPDRAAVSAYAELAVDPDAPPRLACLPLVVDGFVLGVMLFGFAVAGPFSVEERDFLQAVAGVAAHALARVRAYEAERRGRQRLERLVSQALRVQSLGEQLSRTLAPDAVATLVVDETVAALGAETAGLWVVEPDAKHARMLRARGYGSAGEREFARITLSDDTPISEALRTGRAIYLRSRQEYAARYPWSEERTRPLSADRGMQIACLPLTVDRRVVGGMALVFPAARALDEDEQRFLALIARQTAEALERWRLWERTREAARRAQLLAVATARLADATSGGQVFQVFVDELAEPVGAGFAGFFLADAGGRLQLAAHWGASAATPAGRRAVDAASAAAAQPFAERRPLFVEPEGDEAPALALLPFAAQHSAAGVLAVGFAAPHRFSVEERAFFEAFAAQAAHALDRARLYQAEAAARTEAEQASRAKDEFLAMLGHELRNPLAPIVTALQLMKLRAGAVGREHDVIERQVQHLLRLVDDLLDVSRITRGKVELKRAPVDVADVVARAVEMASPLIEQKGHRLAIDLPRGHRVDGDGERLAQVVANLLTNAARYTPPQGNIGVRGERAGDRVLVRVRDDGVGITAELLPRVFDLFVQGQRGVDRAEGGLGLGLTLVRRLVEMHGGTVRALSDGPGRGSEFVVELPAMPAVSPAPEPPPPPAPWPARSGAGLRVLLVDDNVDAVDLVAEALRDAGHEVRVAYDGVEALRTVDEFVPDVAVLDLGLPVMDGLELAQRLRARPELAGVKLVALTGYGQAHDRARTAAAGFVRHLVKPTSIEELLRTIDASRLSSAAG